MHTKLISYWLIKSKSTATSGYTLIEALVVVLIIGILASIGLPAVLSQADRGREAQAIAYAGSVADAQIYHRTFSPVFAQTLEELSLNSIPAETRFYFYRISSATATEASFQAEAKDSGLKSISSLATSTGGKVVCRTLEPSATPPPVLVLDGVASCGAGSEKVE